MAIETFVLAAFGGGEILANDIPTRVTLVFLISLACPCIFYDEIKSEHAHNRHTRGGGERACKVTT